MSDMNDDKWRARIPFMRLPRDFEENLPPVKEGLFGSDIRSPDEGGDGISPLFWFPYRLVACLPFKIDIAAILRKLFIQMIFTVADLMSSRQRKAVLV